MAKTRMTYIFNTDAACKYRLDYQDMAILDWIYTFALSKKMKSKTIYSPETMTSTTYYWLYYQALIDDFYFTEYNYTPLGITNRQVLARHIQSLCERGLLGFSLQTMIEYSTSEAVRGTYTMVSINMTAFFELTGTGTMELRAASVLGPDGKPMNVKQYSAFKDRIESEKQEKKMKKRLYSKAALNDRAANKANLGGIYGLSHDDGKTFTSLYNTSRYNDCLNDSMDTDTGTVYEAPSPLSSCSPYCPDLFTSIEEEKSVPSVQEEGTDDGLISFEEVPEGVKEEKSSGNGHYGESPSLFIDLKPNGQPSLDQTVEPDIKTLDNKLFRKEQAEDENKAEGGNEEWIKSYLGVKDIGVSPSLINPFVLRYISEQAMVFGLDDHKLLKGYIDYTVQRVQKRYGRANTGRLVLSILAKQDSFIRYRDLVKKREDKKRYSSPVLPSHKVRTSICPVCGTEHEEGCKCHECGLELAEDSEEVEYRKILYKADKSLLEKYDRRLLEGLSLRDLGYDFDAYRARKNEIRREFMPKKELEIF